jgi:hypothetical protein
MLISTAGRKRVLRRAALAGLPFMLVTGRRELTTTRSPWITR